MLSSELKGSLVEPSYVMYRRQCKFTNIVWYTTHVTHKQSHHTHAQLWLVPNLNPVKILQLICANDDLATNINFQPVHSNSENDS